MNTHGNKFPLNPILLVDDEADALTSFEMVLRSGGFSNTMRCESSREVIPILESKEIDLILLDLLMPDIPGEEILSAVVRDFPQIPVIMVTGIDEVDTAVRCMRQGAFDYVVKPVEGERLVASIRRAAEVRQLRRENTRLARHFISDTPEHPDIFSHIITRNRKMGKIFRYCEAIAPGFHPILITGETGVGKELIAESLHRLSGRKGRFVAVNVAGLDDDVFSDTLFGHAKGAFTGADSPRQGLVERAAGGTLLLDEIGDLSEASQIKLLRLLDQREYFPLGADLAKPSDARFLAATHKSPEELRQNRNFRSDLFYRVCAHHVHLPPLRERSDDIPLLFEHFLDMAAKDLGKKKPAYHQELLTLLSTYHFPGNIRELKAMVLDALSRHESKMLSSETFREYIRKNRDTCAVPMPTSFAQNGESWASALAPLPTLKDAAQTLVQEAMRRSDNNQRVAATMLGITPQALNQRLRRAREVGSGK